MMIKTDGSGNQYIESTLPNNEAVRVSFIKSGWTGGNCIRINLRDTNNHIRQGAEFPITNTADVLKAIQTLLNDR